MRRPNPARSEQLIGVLVPAAGPLPCPDPVSMPELPVRRPSTGPELPVLDMARLDRSGRLSVRPLLTALGWRPGHRVHIDVVDGVLTIASAVTSGHVVTGRGELVVPAAMRRLCGIADGSQVVLAGYPSTDLVTVHPANAVAQVLGELHARRAGGRHAG
ncbi:hypothetical protein [Phytohabitans rumicis]|uniref:hypothetical protein n=1 Tax=Phytohabitans rumicis TaxID=1076125 RepID=UPI0015632AFA|nr:hypothetical protein [Phytohabitans rumicis]